jgi:hypothetical protein
MKRISAFASVAAVVLVFVAPVLSAAVTIHVPDDQPTIQAGLDAAAAGDTVIVDCGVYDEHDIAMPTGVWLRSASGDPLCVTIDAQQEGRVMRCEGADAETIIQGVTLTGGRVGYSGSDRNRYIGGGLYCDDSLDGPKVIDCIFLKNESASYGGGVHCGTSGTPYFRRCKFIENSCINSGGGAYSTGGLGEVCTPSFKECVFDGNHAAESGGGCSSYGFSASGGSSRATVEFWDCDFIGNDAYIGGALQAINIGLSVDGCLFVGNDAYYYGGVFRVFNCPSAVVVGSTMVGNTAMFGSAIHAHETDVEIERSVIAFGTDGDAVTCSSVGGQAYFSCSDVYGNAGGDWVGCIKGQDLLDGNFSGDPLFCGDQTPDLPYSIDVASPCAPENNACGVLIGCRNVGCGPSNANATTWGRLKAGYR